MNRKSFIQQSSVAAAGILLTPSFSFGKRDEPVLGNGHKRYRLDTKWGELDAAKYPVKDCHEMVQDKQGRILLLTNETKNNVIIYDKKGKLISTWGTTYPGAHGLTLFDENGTEVLFICDNNRHQVIKTTIDGKELLVLDYPKETGMYTKAEEYIPTETAIAANGDIFLAASFMGHKTAAYMPF